MFKGKYRTVLLIIIFQLLILVNNGIAELGVSADTPSVDFGTSTKTDLDVGFKEIDASAFTYAVRLSVSDTGPVNWILSVKASTADFSSTFGTKPCGDLQWKLNGSGSYASLATSDSTVTTGNGNSDIDVDYKLLSDWSDVPDFYNLVVIYTIAEDI